VQEELNIDVSKVAHRLLGHLKQKDGVQVFQQVYEIQSDETPNYNQDDFSEAFWLTPQEIVKKIEGGESAKHDLIPLLQKYYL
jgi:isopentenyl-diphosphate delta-isomerase